MINLHKEILSNKQLELLPIVKYFSTHGFYLVGGTALALQIGHRESIDFDMFSYRSFNNQKVRNNIKDLLHRFKIKDEKIFTHIDEKGNFTFIVNEVKFTFFQFPFVIKDKYIKEDIKLVRRISIGAMKAFALGRKAKWKDYVDIYMLLQEYSLEDIISKAEDTFGTEFSSIYFLQQLCYFKDIDHSEKVIWKIDNPPTDKLITQFLSQAVSKLV